MKNSSLRIAFFPLAISSALVGCSGDEQSDAVDSEARVVVDGSACKVVYEVVSEWSGGFTANVSVTNKGAPISAWQLEWDFPSGQSVNNLWEGRVTQSGPHVTVAAPGWSANLERGASAKFGFNGGLSDKNTSPKSFKLNGRSCDDGGGTVPPDTTPGGSGGGSNGGGSSCSAPKYEPGKAYNAGDAVESNGKLYKCREWPYSGWCGIGGVYAPEGAHGGDAWALVGDCNGGGTPGGNPGTGGGDKPPGGGNPGGGNPGGGNDSGKLFVGYYQSWSDKWQADGANTQLAKLPSYVNVVNLSFMQTSPNYRAGSMSLGGTGLDFPYDGPTLKAAIDAYHKSHPGGKVLVSVGGATFPNWSAFNPESVAAFVNDFGLDGVDLDYEPANAACKSSGGSVSCPSDAEYTNVVRAMRKVLPRPKWVTIAAWHVGAYGEGAWANATPASAYTGISLAMLKNAGSDLDLVNVMSYDAGPTFEPKQALAAYQNFYKGRIAMGIEVPPEAWGGHVYTIAEINALGDAVNASGAAGLMLWSIQKQGPAQEFATAMCNKLGLGNCSAPML